MTCTFFGHANTPDNIRPQLIHVLTELILHHDANTFYLGHQGNFDRMARSVLRELQKTYPHIRYTVVLAYRESASKMDAVDTVYPEGLENVPKRFSISFRNRWMIDHSQCVITYARGSAGHAGHWAALAQRKGKTVVNLYSISRDSEKTSCRVQDF